MNERAYCTYFDSGYLSRGRALIDTLRQQGDNSVVYVLTLDDASRKQVAEWFDLNVRVVSLGEIEEAYPQLLEARSGRSRMEYFFTITPWLSHWTLSRVNEGGWVTYLDADMAFYSSTDPLFDEAGNGSIAIIEHRFTWEQAWRRKYGRFNVGWVGFRNDARGNACLKWWADSCLRWCYDQVSDGRFADQGYLDGFVKFPGLVVIQHPGADLAPWNLRRHRVTLDHSGKVLVDDEPLIFFHFHGLRRDHGRYFFKHLPYLARTTSTVRDHIYRPYCEQLEVAETRAGGASAPQLARQPTLAKAIRVNRSELLRWVGYQRRDYLDVHPRNQD